MPRLARAKVDVSRYTQQQGGAGAGEIYIEALEGATSRPTTGRRRWPNCTEQPSASARKVTASICQCSSTAQPALTSSSPAFPGDAILAYLLFQELKTALRRLLAADPSCACSRVNQRELLAVVKNEASEPPTPRLSRRSSGVLIPF